MNKAQVLKTPGERAEEVALFVGELNSRPSDQIGYYGDDAKEIRHFLIEETPEVLQRSVVALEDGEVVGFLGAETDAEVGRTWLYGPHIRHDGWDEIADHLYAELGPLLTDDAPEHELFFNVANGNVQRFGSRQGFDSYKDSEIMRFTRAGVASLPEGTARPVEQSEIDAVVELHDRLFPTAPWTGRQVIDRRGDHETVLVAAEEDRVLGYVHARVNPVFPEGNIEFVGVDDAARGQGLGTLLVSSALRWMFSFDHMTETWLTVMEDTPGARRIYVKLGFESVHSMRGMRKRI